MTILASLKAVKAKIKTRRSWCRGTLAQDSAKWCVPVNSDAAVKWCVVGAILAVLGEGTARQRSLHSLLDKHAGDLYKTGIMQLNDSTSRGFPAVHKVLDAAIAAKERK